VARKPPLTSLKQISEINLTPLMDLTFILLITFIITFPLIEQGIPVDLPQGKAKELSPDTAYSITLDREGNVYLNDARVTLDQLSDDIVEAAILDPDITVMIRADERNMYGRVVKILKILNDAKISRMALVTREDGEAR